MPDTCKPSTRTTSRRFGGGKWGTLSGNAASRASSLAICSAGKAGAPPPFVPIEWWVSWATSPAVETRVTWRTSPPPTLTHPLRPSPAALSAGGGGSGSSLSMAVTASMASCSTHRCAVGSQNCVVMAVVRNGRSQLSYSTWCPTWPRACAASCCAGEGGMNAAAMTAVNASRQAVDISPLYHPANRACARKTSSGESECPGGRQLGSCFFAEPTTWTYSRRPVKMTFRTDPSPLPASRPHFDSQQLHHRHAPQLRQHDSLQPLDLRHIQMQPVHPPCLAHRGRERAFELVQDAIQIPTLQIGLLRGVINSGLRAGPAARV